MTPTTQASKITELTFDAGFTGDAKIFVKVENAGSGSEKLVIYERSGIAAFFTDIFRNRRNTFTLREWASHKQGSLPKALNKERLTQNIKQIKQAMKFAVPQPVGQLQAGQAVEPLGLRVINKLVTDKKLDDDTNVVSSHIKNALPGVTFQQFSEYMMRSLQSILEGFGMNKDQISSVMKGNGDGIDPNVIQAAEKKLREKNDPAQVSAFAQLISTESAGGFIAPMKIMSMAIYLSSDGDIQSLGQWPASEAKSFAKFLLALDKGPSADDVKHPLYINSLQQAIVKLEAREKLEKLREPQT